MNNLENCPHCKVSLIGEPIPEANRKYYSPPYHYKREIGMQYPGVYDGVWEWMCPDCRGKWPSEANILRQKLKARRFGK